MGALIYDNTITSTTDVVTISLTNPIVKGELYELSITPVYNSASNLKIFYNGNNNSNYVLQYLISSGSSNSAGRESGAPPYVAAGASGSGQSNTYIKLTNNGYVVSQSHMINLITNPSSLQQFYSYGTTTYTVSSITSIGIVANNPNGIAAGTRIQLRKVGEKVYDYEVPTATSSVVIPDLNIGKENEYLLISDYFNDGTGRSHSVFINDNNTKTNYWTQIAYFYSNIIGTFRTNDSSTISGTTNERSLGITKLKLTNDGYFTWQTNSVRTYGTGSPEIGQSYGTSTFQVSSINKITMQPTELHQIGVGSRFELYKLY